MFPFLPPALLAAIPVLATPAGVLLLPALAYLLTRREIDLSISVS